MKIQYFDDFDEVVPKQKAAYQKNKYQYPEWTDDDYDRYSKELISTPVDNKMIFGYLSTDKVHPVYVKWNKNNELYIVYRYKNEKPFILTMYRKSKRSFESDKWGTAYGYVDEITDEK